MSGYNIGMDVIEQIRYWLVSSQEDFAASESLLEKGHLRHCLFFAHLAVEKMIKANIVAVTKDIPPRIHNLVRLSQCAMLNLDEEQTNRLLEFGAYQLEGRYPDSQQMPLNEIFVKNESLSE